MRIVSIKQIDVREIVSLWNECLGIAFPMSEALWVQNTIDDINVQNDGSIGMYEGEELVGFTVVKIYQEKLSTVMPRDIGWIQCLVVKPTFQKKGIGERLLKKAEEALLSASVKEIRLGRDPWHYFPGVPKENPTAVSWFKKHGYQVDSVETDLLKNIALGESLPLKNSLTSYRLLKDKDLPELVRFLGKTFPGRWHYEAIHYAKIGNGREFIGLFIDNELKGFCRINDPTSPMIAQNVYWSKLFTGTLGGIGPLGVDRQLRGKHYGIDLVKAATNELIARGMEHIVIDWTQLVEFYEKLGYSIWKQYVAMSKKIEVG